MPVLTSYVWLGVCWQVKGRSAAVSKLRQLQGHPAVAASTSSGATAAAVSKQEGAGDLQRLRGWGSCAPVLHLLKHPKQAKARLQNVLLPSCAGMIAQEHSSSAARPGQRPGHCWQGFVLRQQDFESSSDVRNLSGLRNTDRCTNCRTDPVQVQS